ncbi:MAG: acetyltransferase [Bacteroidetes bacterium]|nr:acetyltransferase [Bacteroidota bacterium]
MNNQVILIGGFNELVELCQENDYKIIGIIDNILKNNFMGYPILGCDDDAEDLFGAYGEIPLVITPDSPKVRNILFDLYSSKGFRFATIISKRANVSPSATIGRGVVLQSGVNVSSASHIGDFVKLNSNANVMHDSNIGAFTTIAPNAVVLGRVRVGQKVYLGANSTILPELNIADETTVGAGAVVIKDITVKGVYVGIPAKKIK